MDDLTRAPWWEYLEEGQRDGLVTSRALLRREREHPTPNTHDFSFVVFPASKAYEGFLKKLFYELGFITKLEYEGDRFRIGRALNPALEKDLRHESIYDKLASFCQDNALPDQLWQAWKHSRNLLFHWWPAHKNVVTIEEAQERVQMIIDAIDAAFAECKVKR